MRKVTIVGTRYPDNNIVKYAALATRICVKNNCIISTGDAIGIDKIARDTTRFINKKARVDIYSAKDKEYPYRNNWTYYLDQMQNTNIAEAIAEHIHPAWDKCSEFARALHSRNPYQVMGLGLLEPTDLTITFAPFGDNVKGGTRTAYELSRALGIPTLNLYGRGHQIIEELWDSLFINNLEINWDYVETLRKPIRSDIATIIEKYASNDPELLKLYLLTI